MAIALTLQEYLNDQNISYEVMMHERTSSSTRTAQASHVPGDRLAKGVVLTKEGGFVLAVLPASCKVRLDAIEKMFQCPITLATEDEISSIFADCEVGAVPPIGAAYALDCVVDESLEQQADLYLEGGDHRSLIHINHAQFHKLMNDVPHGHFAMRADGSPVMAA
jgi:Ala-tRNA(Pro) deacylase